MSDVLRSKVPGGPLEAKWSNYRNQLRLVAPNNRRKFQVLVVGSGLAGASAAATLGEAGYRVKCFCFQDSPRRAHSIAAQGGINAAKNYRNDGDSIFRLFYDTIKGGDFRSREANVYRLAEVSVEIIDQAVAQGVPFAREYKPANSSFSAPTKRSHGRSTRAPCRCTTGPRCSTSSWKTAWRGASSRET